jgi:dihydroxy-acid dehydratase
VDERTLNVEVDDDELARRTSSSSCGPADPGSGWSRLYVDHVTQANEGADLDFLVGRRGAEVGRESH